MTLQEEEAATRARSRVLCARSIALCSEVLSLTTPLGEPVLGDGPWRYFAARLSAARVRLGAGTGVHACR